MPPGPPRAVAPIWSGLDVLAVVTLVVTVAVALLGALGVMASGAAELVWACLLTAVTAGVGGMALTQVLHRMHRSMVERAEQRIRSHQRAE
jgi:ABC-type proline/glycine betaine transport system permease subunit